MQTTLHIFQVKNIPKNPFSQPAKPTPKTYTFPYFYQQYLVLFTMVPRKIGGGVILPPELHISLEGGSETKPYRTQGETPPFDESQSRFPPQRGRAYRIRRATGPCIRQDLGERPSQQSLEVSSCRTFVTRRAFTRVSLHVRKNQRGHSARSYRSLQGVP